MYVVPGGIITAYMRHKLRLVQRLPNYFGESLSSPSFGSTEEIFGSDLIFESNV